MVQGLLMELEECNCWSIAEAAGHSGPHRLQHLLSRAVWDEQQLLDTAAAWAVSHLGDQDAVLIVDETADEKSSADAVGAARQYSGTVGGIALCQVAVTLTLAASRGHALIGRALYLPGTCAADEEHREMAGVPEEVMSRPSRSWPGIAGPRARARDPCRLRGRCTRFTADGSCAARSAAAAWGICWRSARTTPSPPRPWAAP